MINQIAVVGTGYVGLSLSILLSQKHKVITLDINKEKVKLINQRKSPLNDKEMENYLANKNLKLTATLNKVEAYKGSDYIIIATPTDYDNDTGTFNTEIVENVIKEILEINDDATIVIKSTVPIGFTDQMKLKYGVKNIFFSPEFLRESKALYDNLFPARIVVGDQSEQARKFANLLLEVAIKDQKEIEVYNINNKEAESIKLFSNTFLAMRVAFFNELDSFSEVNQLDTEALIKGVCADPRIGDYYNNPSYGYGGYCLPKDSQQLLSSYQSIPNNIIDAVVKANKTRKEFIVNSIMSKSPKVVGVYRLIMKNESDNFRESAVLDVIEMLNKKNIEIILYEPLINEKKFNKMPVINNLNEFANLSDLIIANRMTDELEFVKSKIYTRDIFGNN